MKPRKISPEELEANRKGLANALEVAHTGRLAEFSEGDSKLLGFFLRQGECDATIGERGIEVRYSWLNHRKPSTYYGQLSPGLISKLMELGGVKSVREPVEFAVGPGTTGIDRYQFSFTKKWVAISCPAEEIQIRIRDKRKELMNPLKYETST